MNSKTHFTALYCGLTATIVLLTMSYVEKQRLTAELAELTTKPAARNGLNSLKSGIAVIEPNVGHIPTDEELAKKLGAAVSEAVMRSTPIESIFPADKTVVPGLLEMLQNPEFAGSLLQKFKMDVDANYSHVFRHLNLDPVTAERLRQLLAEKPLSMYEAATLGRIDGTGGVLKSFLDSGSKIDDEIAALLGEKGFAKFEYFNETRGIRKAADQLAARLSYSGESLTPTQLDSIVDAVYTATPERSSSRARFAYTPGTSRTEAIDIRHLDGIRKNFSETQYAVIATEVQQINQMRSYEQAHNEALQQMRKSFRKVTE